MKDRLLKFIQNTGLSAGRFAEKIDVQPSAISHLLSGRNKPGYDFISKLISTFPELNLRWLILGEGEMYSSSPQQIPMFKEQIPHSTEGQETALFADLFTENMTAVGSGLKSSLESVVEGQRISQSNQIASVASPDHVERKVKKIIFIYNDNSFDVYHE